jgi:preprotein translocase subunit SecG
MNSFTAVLPYIQILLSVLLVGGILLQRSDAGLGGAFGGDGFSSTKFERRGFEKTLFNATIVIAVLFVLSTVLSLFLAQ